MLRPVKKLDRFLYYIDKIELNHPDWDENIIIKNNGIRTMSIIRDYDNNVSPSISLQINVPKESYEKVITGMSSLVAKFTMVSEQVATGDELENGTKIGQKTEVITCKYKAVNHDNIDTSSVNQLALSRSNDQENITMNDSSMYLINLNLLLYDHESMIQYRQLYSYIIKGGINDCLYKFFNDRKFKNILMSSVPDNSYGQYAIPYGHLGDNLRYLNDVYGIYNSPYLFFIDFDTIYLLDKGNLGKTLQQTEFGQVNIYIENTGITASQALGSYVDTDNQLYVLNSYPPTIIDNDSVADFYAGSKIISIESGSGKTYTDSIDSEYTVARAYSVNNSKIHNQTQFTINESKREISFVFYDIDLSIITPNKIYNVIPDELYYSSSYNIAGKYRLSKSIVSLQGEGDQALKNSVLITLKKLQDL